MRTHAFTAFVTLVSAWAALSAAATDAAPSFLFLDPADPTFAEVRRHGERTLDQAGTALVLEIRRLVASATPDQLLGAVHLKNFKLPASPAGRPRVIGVRFTSTQVRNPAHAPDAADQAALDRIREEIENADAVSPLLLQRVSVAGQPDEWRVYRPLVLLPECIACHGAADKLAPGVADALKAAYPDDKATGYRAGQWRGLLRVSLRWPAD